MTSNKEQVIRESLRQSEEILRSQLAIAIAADTRALTFCGITLAAASLLAGLAGQASVGAAMFVASGFLYASAALAAWSAMPVDWYAPGQPGRDFDEDIASDKAVTEVMREMVAHNDSHFDHNERIRAAQSRWLRISASLAAVAAPVGMLVQVVAWTAR